MPGQAEQPLECGGDAHVALLEEPPTSTASSLPPRTAARRSDHLVRNLREVPQPAKAPQTARRTRPMRPPLHPQVARRPSKTAAAPRAGGHQGSSWCHRTRAARSTRTRTRGSLGSSFSSRWISSLNGSSFDGRSGHRNIGGRSERNATRIVLRASPVRRTSSLIDTPRTNLPAKLGPALHIPHASFWLSIATDRARLTTTPDASPPPTNGGQFSAGEGRSVFHRRRHEPGTWVLDFPDLRSLGTLEISVTVHGKSTAVLREPPCCALDARDERASQAGDHAARAAGTRRSRSGSSGTTARLP